MEYKFDVTKIKSNGITYTQDTYVNQETSNYIKTYLQTYLMLNSVEDIVPRLNKENPDYGFGLHVGTRVKDTNTIMNRIVSAISEYASPKFEESILTQSWVSAQIQLCTAKELTTIIESAILDCAAADHWYTFEKEWE